jgi:hypothetical protein
LKLFETGLFKVTYSDCAIFIAARTPDEALRFGLANVKRITGLSSPQFDKLEHVASVFLAGSYLSSNPARKE